MYSSDLAYNGNGYQSNNNEQEINPNNQKEQKEQKEQKIKQNDDPFNFKVSSYMNSFHTRRQKESKN